MNIIIRKSKGRWIAVFPNTSRQATFMRGAATREQLIHGLEIYF